VENFEHYYNSEEGKTHSLGILIERFKSSEDAMSSYSGRINDDLYRVIEDFKYHGDASAHVIEPDISDEDIEELTEKATELAKILFEMREKVLTAG
jgi:hypothetical protein